ncbi:hypothetical protein [Gallaecimonas xiamenensis]|uniref:hypothetical protein n=1 Tax=Gallaecimonas xiamenensis TaxID=1207039 RepID=UPI0004BA93BF|nr:hypothetical protein [Gallaecimonas xiamenensis]
MTRLQGAMAALMALGLALAVAHLVSPLPLYWAGMVFWLAALLKLPSLPPLLKSQVLLLTLAGATPLAVLLALGKDAQWQRALAVNLPLICIILAAGLLKLICLPAPGKEGAPAKGPKALWQTLFGVHAFSAAINMSALYIAADRLSAQRPLDINQASVLARAFTLSMYWSPLMAGMALALSWAPGASLSELMRWGLVLALLSLLITALQIRLQGKGDYQGFVGFPVSLSSLAIPAFLTVLVLGISHLAPTLSVPLLVAGLAPLLTLGVMFWRKGTQGVKALARHGREQLPAQGGELCLFLAAGLFAVGLSNAFGALGLGQQQLVLNHWHTLGILAGIVLLAYLGLHPIASIAIAGSWTQAMVVDPNLLAFTYLASWSIGVIANPFSGTMLAMVARYGVPYHNLRRHNLPFVLVSLVLAGVLMALIPPG